MALAIRLARGGMKKKPYYRIVVTDSRNAHSGIYQRNGLNDFARVFEMGFSNCGLQGFGKHCTGDFKNCCEFSIR